MGNFFQIRRQVRLSQSGNIFIFLLGATILLGLLGATLTGTIKGPVTAVQYITQKSRVEMTLHNAAKLMIASTFDHQASGGDCDADSFIEPMPYRVAPNGVPAPAGGGLLPEGLASGTRDAWGSEIGYCVWDHGPQTMEAGCGGAAAQRLRGGNTITEVAIAFISAGPDRVFQTTCNAFTDTNGDGIPDTPLVQKGAGQDDIVIVQTYGESMVAGKIGAGASELTDLPDDACTPDNIGILRYSMGATQVCKENGWEEVGGAPEAADNFADVVNASLEGVYTSNAIAFSSFYGTRMASVAGGATIILNGVDVGATAEIAAGDMVALRATAADTPEIKQDYIFSISTFTRPWSITTRDYTPPNFTISPSARSGMNVTASATPSYGANVVFTVTNTGEITSAAITAPSVSPDTNFQITATTCTGAALAQNATCTVTVRPMAVANGNYSAVMTVTDGTATRTASVSGAASGFTVNCSESMVVGCVDTDGARYAGMNDDEPMFITATPETGTYRLKTANTASANTASDDDGRGNTEAMISAGASAHPGAQACMAKGALWYMPALTELQQIMGHHATLKEQAADLGTAAIWTSTHASATTGNAITFSGGSANVSTPAKNAQNKLLCARKPEGPVECLQGISAGYSSACGLATDGRAYCWGRNHSGQLGNGDTTDQSTPVPVQIGDNTAGTYTQIATGQYSTCGLATDGRAYCWGRNVYGELGNGSYSGQQNTPVLVQNGANTSGTYKQISVGTTAACGLATDGKAYCWGGNGAGQLGNGDGASKSTPVLVQNGANASGTYTQITIGQEATCGLGTDGKAYCWGRNNYGQLGDNTTTNRPAPVLVLNGANSAGTYKQLVMGEYYACGLGTDEKVYCWGTNGNGALGDGTTTQRNIPVLAQNGANVAGTYKQISAGSSFTCGLATDGKAYCWGRNVFGQLGSGNTTQQTTPVLVQNGANTAGIYTQISAGIEATCGLGTNSRAYCWGRNNYMEVGDGTAIQRSTPVLVSKGDNPNGKYCRPMASCLMGDRTIGHGETITAYSAPAHTSCSSISQERTCTNGTLSGNAGFQYDACIGEFLESFENWAGTAPVDWTDKSNSYMNRSQTSNLSHVTHGSKAMVLQGDEMADVADIWRPIDFTHYKSMSIDVTNFQNPLSQITVYTAATASGPSGTRTFNLPLTGTGKFEADISWITGMQYLSIGDGRQNQNLIVDNLRLKFAEAEDNNRCLPTVGVGNEHSCALGTDGKAYCWGQGSSGQLGNGLTTSEQTTPVAVSNGTNTAGTYKILSSGALHNCAIGSNDRVYCWGSGANGRLGNSNTAQQTTPVLVSNGANTAGTYRDVQSGSAHSCGVGLDKKAYCWGLASSGQLGNGSTTQQNVPVAVSNGANATGGFKSVATAAGASHSCGIGLDDKAYCWGVGTNGRLGNGNTAQQNTPVLVSDGQNSLSTYKQVVVGTGYSCGIAADDKAYCWGVNSYGQLGTGNTTQRTTAYLVVNGANTAGTYKTLAAGDNHTCGVGTDDKLYCWGYNNMGQLGTGNTTNQSSPFLVPNGANTTGLWDQVNAGSIHTCGIGRDGKTYCWGHGGFGKTGQGNTNLYTTPVLVQDGANNGGNYKTCGIAASGGSCSLAAGTNATYALGSDNRGYHWGFTIGFSTTSTAASIPTGANTAGTYKEIHAGHGGGCGLSNDYRAYCWGNNAQGQIGDGSTTSRNTPVLTANGDNGTGLYRSLTAGYSTYCGIGADIRAYCWGKGDDGQIGNGATSNQSSPTAVSNGANTAGTYKSVTSYFSHVCGIGSNDRAYCWGSGGAGKLGNGASADSSVPVLVSNGANTAGTYKQLALRLSGTCGLGIDNKAYCWGTGSNGQLGNGTASSNIPVAVSNGSNSTGLYASITSGNSHTCGLGTDARVYCWGLNDLGQLGDNSTTDKTTPTLVSNGANPSGTYISITAGQNHTCGLGGDGKAYCWGEGAWGKLGRGGSNINTAPNSSTPILVLNGANTEGTYASCPADEGPPVVEACTFGALGTTCSDGAIYIGTVGSNRIYAAPSDESGRSWKTSESSTSGTLSATDGLANTNAMITAGASAHPAGNACKTKSPAGTWYLPATDELGLLWTNRATLNLSSIGINTTGTHPAGWYWASTQEPTEGAWGRNFNYGGSQTWVKNLNNLSIRCVRR